MFVKKKKVSHGAQKVKLSFRRRRPLVVASFTELIHLPPGVKKGDKRFWFVWRLNPLSSPPIQKKNPEKNKQTKEPILLEAS